MRNNRPDTPTTWPEYFKAITSNAPGAEIARRTQISESTISRWLSGITKPSARQVERVALAYGVHVSDALRIAGHLKAQPEDELARKLEMPHGLALRQFTVQELAQEILRRAIAEGDDSDPPAVNGDPEVEVTAKISLNGDSR